MPSAGADRAPTRPDAGNRVMRGLLAITTAIIGSLILLQSAAQVALANGSIDQADNLAPWDGRMAAAQAAALTQAGADPAQIARLAMRALRRDPTTVGAAVVLAVRALTDGDNARGRRLFTYSQALSRRDFSTQLWAIEDAVSRQDIVGAVGHYDIALRTEDKAADLLFPVLNRSLNEPAIRAALVQTLAKRPPWADAFMYYTSVQAIVPAATADLFSRLQRAHIAIPANAQVQLQYVLIANNAAPMAWALYAASRPGGGDGRRSRDPMFTAINPTPAQFDWVLPPIAGATTSIQRSGSTGVFDFATGPNVAGALLQQVQLLPPGSYRIVGRSAGIDQPEPVRPYWALRCLADNRELGRVVVTNSSVAGGQFVGDVMVPRDCPTQVLALVAQPSQAVAGVSGQIRQVSLASMTR